MTQIPGSEEELKCDLLLIAAGFLGPKPYIPEAFGAELDARGNIKTTDFKTSIDKLFSAGDARRGQSLVVHAINEGRLAAREIDKYLMGYTNL